MSGLPHKRYERLMKQYDRALLTASILEGRILDLLAKHSTPEEQERRNHLILPHIFGSFNENLSDELADYRREDGR